MRKIALIFALLLPCALFSQVTFHRYLDNTYTWLEFIAQEMFATGQPPCYIGGQYQSFKRYHVMGEDTIDGHAWYQIHYDAWNETYCGTGGGTPIVTTYFIPSFSYRLREDSLGNIWQRSDTDTRLLYEFRPGLGIGDTLWMDNRLYSCAIDSLDTLMLGTDLRKRYWCDCDAGLPTAQRDFIVEGVGFKKGFSNTSSLCQQQIDHYSYTVCVEKDGDTLVLNPQQTCGKPAHNPVSVEEQQLDGLRVAWLPGNEELVMERLRPLPAFEWEVLDMQGRVLSSGKDFRERIPLPGLSSGVYLFRAQSGGRPLVLKFVQ